MSGRVAVLASGCQLTPGFYFLCADIEDRMSDIMVTARVRVLLQFMFSFGHGSGAGSGRSGSRVGCSAGPIPALAANYAQKTDYSSIFRFQFQSQFCL